MNLSSKTIWAAWNHIVFPTFPTSVEILFYFLEDSSPFSSAINTTVFSFFGNVCPEFQSKGGSLCASLAVHNGFLRFDIWCNTCWPLDGQLCSLASLIHILVQATGGTQTCDEMCGTVSALTIWAIPSVSDNKWTCTLIDGHWNIVSKLTHPLLDKVMLRNQWHIGAQECHLMLKDLHIRPYMATKWRCVWNKTFLLGPIIGIRSFRASFHHFS